MGCNTSTTLRHGRLVGSGGGTVAGPMEHIGLQQLAGVEVPDVYRQQSGSIAAIEERAISLAQLKHLLEFCNDVFSSSFGQLVECATASKYDVNSFVTSPLTRPFQCSFVELIAPEPQLPKWFVSHAWSQGLQETVKLLAYHAEVREDAVEGVYYWICTFANNQHDLGALNGHLEETPFFKAIMLPSCRGTVALICEDVALFKRVWCIYECHISTVEVRQQAGKKEHLYDMAVPQAGMLIPPYNFPESVVLRLDLGNGNFREVCNFTPPLPDGRLCSVLQGGTCCRPGITVYHPVKQQRLVESGLDREVQVMCGQMDIPSGFPFCVASAAMKLDVATALASKVEDRRTILHSIAGTVPEERGGEPPKVHENYRKLNRRFQAQFVSSAMTACLVFGDEAELIRLLAFFPEECKTQPSHGMSHASVAAFFGHVACMRVLLAENADINCMSQNQLTPTPVSQALIRGEIDAVRLLLEARADPHLGSPSAMDFAKIRGADDECATLVLDAPLPDVSTIMCI